ncbi:unnamed protein product [Chrysoparadoxa australica]
MALYHRVLGRKLAWFAFVFGVYTIMGRLSLFFKVSYAPSFLWMANAVGVFLLLLNPSTVNLVLGLLATLAGCYAATYWAGLPLGLVIIFQPANIVEMLVGYYAFRWACPSLSKDPNITRTPRFIWALLLSVVILGPLSLAAVILIQGFAEAPDRDAQQIIAFATVKAIGDAHSNYFMVYTGFVVRSHIHHLTGSFTPSPSRMRTCIADALKSLQEERLELSVLNVLECLVVLALLTGLGINHGRLTSDVSELSFLLWYMGSLVIMPVLMWTAVRCTQLISALLNASFALVVCITYASGLTREQLDPRNEWYQFLGIFFALIVAMSTTSFAGVFLVFTVELKAVEEEARAAREEAEVSQAVLKAREEEAKLFSHMSHELKTPLNVILGFAQILEAQNLNEDGQVYLKHIRDAGQTLLTLIVDLLDMFRCRAGKLTVRPEKFDLHKFFDGMVAQVSCLGNVRNVRVIGHIALDEVPQYVCLDRLKLTQLLQNLGSNAVKFSPDDSSVTLSLTLAPPWSPHWSAAESPDQGKESVAWYDEGYWPVGQDSDGDEEELDRVERIKSALELRELSDSLCFISISVEDQGEGISDEDCRLIFRDFERLEHQRHAAPGTGVGLAIVQELVKLMGGTVGVTSCTTEGSSGSTFTLTLPLIVCQAPTRRVATVPVSLGRPLTVLVVEDDKINQKLVQRLLKQDGHTVVVASNGLLALHEARKLTAPLFDIVLLDLFMPVLDGEGFLRALREEGSPRSLDGTPVVVTSADLQEGKWELLQSLGAAGCLSKPYRIDRFREEFARLDTHAQRKRK